MNVVHSDKTRIVAGYQLASVGRESIQSIFQMHFDFALTKNSCGTLW